MHKMLPCLIPFFFVAGTLAATLQPRQVSLYYFIQPLSIVDVCSEK
jgi:hypothetical protein